METGMKTGQILFAGMLLSLFLILAIPGNVVSLDVPEISDGEGPEDSNDGHYLPLGDGDQREEQKEIPLKIQGVDIIGHREQTAYPNTPFFIRVKYSAIDPLKLTLLMDLDDPEMRIDYSIRTNEFEFTEVIENFIHVDKNNSRTIFNSTTGNWETDVHMKFKWTMEEGRYFGIGVILESVNGQTDTMDFNNAYVIENDLRVRGEPEITAEDESFITPDGFLKGGSFIKMSGISVTFQGTDQFHPDPEDIMMGIFDSTGRVWNYKPSYRSQLSDIQFSFRTPKGEGPERFTFRVFQTPENCDVDGNGTFQFILDSKPPAMGDLRNREENGRIELDMEVKDSGSGIDLSTLRVRLSQREGKLIKDWSTPADLIIEENRIRFYIESDVKGDLTLEVNIKDRVNNGREEPKVFYFSTLPAERHDVSVAKEIDVSMDPIIERNTIHFTAHIKNSGTIDEQELMVDILLDNELYRRLKMENLLAGTSREIAWDWTADREGSIFTVKLDPLGLVEDIYPDDNCATIQIHPEYRDLTVRSDYLLPSNWKAAEGEVITLSMMVLNTGSIGTDQFKVQVREGSTFLGQYIVNRMEADSSRELDIEWIVDFDVEYIDVLVDPFNEITESVEGNNKVVLENPFYDPSDPRKEEEKEDTDPISPPADEVNDNIDDETGNNDEGGTIWKGPEKEKEDKESSPIQPVPEIPREKPPLENDPPSIMPLILPSVIVTVTLMILGGSLALLRIEPARYKWTLLLIPLYSKLKKSKIEKGVRYELLGYIKAKPGANYTELKRNLDLNDGSLVHHLRVLEREEKIYSKKMGKYKLFYASTYRRKPVIEDYISPFHQRILQIISENPGIVPKRLSGMLDRSQTDISYHLSELSRSGYLDKIKKGRNIHYYINKELMNALLN